jgi:methylthioribulose-1-phosphate dehydratase
VASEEFVQRAQELMAAGHFLFERGWVPATSGNFSARLADGSLAITVSGRHKGRLVADDIMQVDAEGRSLDERCPSAETLLHTHLYQRYPEVQAILHPHSLYAVLLSMSASEEVTLSGYELLKAFPGVDGHEHRVTVPILANDQNIQRLARAVDRRLQALPQAYAYLIAGHGFYTWGDSVESALRHVEACEFLFECEYRRRAYP